MGKARRIKIWCLCFIAVFVAAVSNVTVWASDTGSLSINCETVKNGQTIYLDQDTYAVTKIAEAEIDTDGEIRYTICPNLQVYDRNWSQLTSTQFREEAADLAAYMEAHKMYDRTGQSDSRGKVCFTDLDKGLYLITRIQADEKNAEYQTDPMLVSIPSFEDGQYIYDVSMKLKFDWTQKPITPSVEKTDVTSADHVKTGDTAEVFRYFLLSLAGGIIILLCIYRKYKKG